MGTSGAPGATEAASCLEFLLAYRSIMYDIPVKVEAFDIELNLVGSIPLEEIVTGDPVTIGLNPNMAFQSLNL